jgi:hypothetical protein
VTKQEVQEALRSSLKLTEDRFSNFKFTSGDKQYRVKLNTNSLRIETLAEYEASLYSPASKSWMKLTGSYYKDVERCGNGLLFVKTGRVFKLI